MSETKTYTPAEMNEAKKLAEALVSVPENKRSIFTLRYRPPSEDIRKDCPGCRPRPQ